MKYRNSIQITGSILQATQDTGRDGIKVTTLMSKSNIPHPRLSTILDKLTSSGLINRIEVKNNQTFVITEKGMMYLSEYKKFSDIAGSFGLEL